MDGLIKSFDRRFQSLDRESRDFLGKVSDGQLYLRPIESEVVLSPFSCGEYIVRSAAAVEQVFNGLTTRLWDDPFEWTLPEKLSDKAAVLNYLDEVEATRARGFALFTSDDDLRREIPAPEKLKPIIDVLLDALVKASHYQGRAFAAYQMIPS